MSLILSFALAVMSLVDGLVLLWLARIYRDWSLFGKAMPRLYITFFFVTLVFRLNILIVTANVIDLTLWGFIIMFGTNILHSLYRRYVKSHPL